MSKTSRLHASLCCATLLLSTGATLAASSASSAAPPELSTRLLAPAASWHGASERLALAATDPLATPIEQSSFQVSPGHAATLAYLRKLEQASSLISLHAFGKTFQGRELHYVLAKKPGKDKPVVLVQAGIHAGEIDGKDAGLMLLRDIALRGRSELLDQVDLVFIPILNIDGHENASELGRPNQRGPQFKGARTNAQGLDLNRDYARLQSPEIAAVVRLLRQFDPALYIDVHVSDGTDYQYDITYTYAGWGTYARSQATAAWLMGTYQSDVNDTLTAHGHLPDVYPSWIDEDAPQQGLRISAEGPRYSTGYGDFIGVPTVLVENHTMKPYRRRVLGTYVLLEQSLKTVARQQEQIAQAKASDRAARPAKLMLRWEREPVPLATRQFQGYRYETYQSAASGARELRWTGQPQTIALPVYGVRSTKEVALPTAWWIRPEQQQLIAHLQAQGIAMETLAQPRSLALESVQLDSALARGARGDLLRTRQQVEMPAGSVRVPLDQPRHLLAAALLEPESDDSWLAGGQFDQALPPEARLPRHLLAPMADAMLASDPALRSRFDTVLASDAALAGNPQARLQWLLDQSDYAPRSRWTYPVLMER